MSKKTIFRHRKNESKLISKDFKGNVLDEIEEIVDNAIWNLDFDLMEVDCPKCGKRTKELRIHGYYEIKLFFVIKLDMTLKMTYHPECGYSNVKFIWNK